MMGSSSKTRSSESAAHHLTGGNLLAVVWIAVSTSLAFWFGVALLALKSRETDRAEVESEDEVSEPERQDAAEVPQQPPLALGQRLPDLPRIGDEELFLDGYALHCSDDGIRIRTTDYHAGTLDLSWEKLLAFRPRAN